MTDFPEERWRWWAGADEEHVTIGPCGTRENALAAAINQQTYTELEPNVEHPDGSVRIHVCQGVKPEVADMRIDGDRVLEILEERYEDWAFEDTLFFPNSPAEELGAMLTDTLHQWVARHNIRLVSWCFVATRHDEDVVLPHPSDDAREAI